MVLCMLAILGKKGEKMNLDIIKKDLEGKIGQSVRVQVNGMRNKTNVYLGVIEEVYPNIFTVLVDGETKSFSYVDVVTGEVNLEYL